MKINLNNNLKYILHVAYVMPYEELHRNYIFINAISHKIQIQKDYNNDFVDIRTCYSPIDYKKDIFLMEIIKRLKLPFKSNELYRTFIQGQIEQKNNPYYKYFLNLFFKINDMSFIIAEILEEKQIELNSKNQIKMAKNLSSINESFQYHCSIYDKKLFTNKEAHKILKQKLDLQYDGYR